MAGCDLRVDVDTEYSKEGAEQDGSVQGGEALCWEP